MSQNITGYHWLSLKTGTILGTIWLGNLCAESEI